MGNVREWNPAEGMCFQGDIAIIRIPDDIVIATTEEIRPIDGRLIIQEGEASGHHHAIELPRVRRFRDDTRPLGDPSVATRDRKLRRMFGGKRNTVVARLYRDERAIQTMRDKNILARGDLAIGFLVVEGAPAVVTHEEHDGIRLPVGNYYIGRQVESAGAEERVVAD